MGGISFNAASMPSPVRPRPGEPEVGDATSAASADSTIGGTLVRVQQMRAAVAEGAAAMQARQALGISPPPTTSGTPIVVGGGGASVEDAICGCACCGPTELTAPRYVAEPATADVFQGPASFDPPAKLDVPSQDGGVVEQDDPLPDPSSETATQLDATAPAEDASVPAEDAAAPADAAPATPQAPAPSEGSEFPADAAPHDTTRRDGEPNPVFYGDAPANIPLPPAPGATGTDVRDNPDPGAQLPPGEVDATVPAAGSEPAPEPAASAEDTPPAEPAPAPVRPLGELTPNQFTDGPSLSTAEGNAACGPAAAVAFARFVGQDVSLDHAANVAREVGWDTSGMKGPDTQVQLLQKLGIPAHKEDPVNWDKVRETVQSGTPVIIDTPGHYWVAEGFNPEDGRFNFAKSGAVYGDGGKTWYTPEEMTPHSGAARSAIFLDK